MIRILLADDHSWVRQRLRRIIDAAEGLDLVIETDNGFAALEALTREAIDVALVDITMPGPRWTELIRAIRDRNARTRVLVVSVHASDGYVAEALRAGAAGLLAKDRAADDLVTAVRLAADGGTWAATPASPSLD